MPHHIISNGISANRFLSILSLSRNMTPPYHGLHTDNFVSLFFHHYSYCIILEGLFKLCCWRTLMGFPCLLQNPCCLRKAVSPCIPICIYIYRIAFQGNQKIQSNEKTFQRKSCTDWLTACGL